LRDTIAGDIFIPAPAIGNAMHGDRVLVELGRVRHGERAEGRIVKVAGRAHSTVVGIFHYDQRHNYVTPIDEKITQDVIIPPGAEYPQTEKPARQKASPHRVLGREAAIHADVEDLEGKVVDVEITDWPSPTQNARGKIIEVLGFEDDFGVDVEIIIRKHHLPHVFPDDVLQQAQTIASVIPKRELQRRYDYRDLPIVTIDGETARDFDDAVLVRHLPNGHYELQVHIADVAQYVTEGSAIDHEARLRGTSVYFPDRAVPMLPLELSTDICSLRPEVERLVLSCIMELDRQGELLHYQIHEGVIRSAARMTYTDVQLVLDGDSLARQKYARLVPEFERMQELAEVLNRKRVRRGSIDFDMPEPIIEFSGEGLMTGVTKSERLFSHRLIEEFMLAANEAVATWLEKNGIPSLYRIHEKPDPKKIYEFETLAAGFGYSLGVGALPIKRVQMRADRRGRHGSGRNPRMLEIPEEVHITPRMYQKLAHKIAGKPEERILSFLMLRSLKQARYSEENVGHFALAAPSYTHFTSPIRRYPDLIVHRILKEIIREQEIEDGETVTLSDAAAQGAPSSWSKRRQPDRHAGRRGKHPEPKLQASGPVPEQVLADIAEESSQTERRADDAERELIDWKKIKFMRDRVGEDFDALIISVTKFGFFVELTDMFIEGLVPLQSLTDDRYTYRENTRQIIGERSKKTYSIGDRVRVLLDRIDSVQRKLQFAVLEEKPKRSEKKHRKRV